MSNLDRRPAAQELGGLEATAAGPALDLLPGKEVLLGESTRVRRLLPTLGRRLVGAWAFVDHYGPDDVAAGAGMQVAPHPHTGLQTVSWLLEGAVHHRDSLGSDVAVRPGRARADDGRATASRTPSSRRSSIRGSCTAPSCGSRCPTRSRETAPAFEHHATLPGLDLRRPDDDGAHGLLRRRDLAGHGVHPAGRRRPRPRRRAPTSRCRWSRTSSTGCWPPPASADGRGRAAGARRDALPRHRPADAAADAPTSATRLLLLGGEPFEEQLVMWWNFVGRSGEEIADYAEQWNAESARFGAVVGYDGDRLEAPPLPPVPAARPRGDGER